VYLCIIIGEGYMDNVDGQFTSSKGSVNGRRTVYSTIAPRRCVDPRRTTRTHKKSGRRSIFKNRIAPTVRISGNCSKNGRNHHALLRKQESKEIQKLTKYNHGMDPQQEHSDHRCARTGWLQFVGVIQKLRLPSRLMEDRST
jgi:hypothetical protein